MIENSLASRLVIWPTDNGRRPDVVKRVLATRGPFSLDLQIQINQGAKCSVLAGASVNAQNYYGNIALQHAAQGLHSSQDTQERDHRAALIVARLLEAGADKALVDYAGKTARRYAETRRHTRVIALLRDEGAT